MSVSVFGSLNWDVALSLPARPAWGETVLVASSASAVGGKGLNQAIASRRFGSVTQMSGAVGDDPAGALLLEALRDDGVDTGCIAILPGEPSGRATILIAPGGDNMIAVEPGANLSARADQALGAIDGDTRVLLAQLECGIDQIAAWFTSEAAASACKILNAAPAVPQGEALFGLADVLIFNQAEFAQFAGVDREPSSPGDLVSARRLLTRPGQAVVVTLGAIGAAAITADDTVFAPAIPAAAIVDTSGAGDCFCGVLAACLDQGIAMADALRWANAAASLSVGKHGAAPSMPWRRDVEARLQMSA